MTVALVVWPARQLPPQQPTFRAGVDYVRVDVVVTDSHDQPITDLTRADFEIVERGRSQAITDFQFVSVPVPERSSGPVPPPEVTPDVVTNTAPSPEGRVFVVVVDDLHIIESDLIDTKKVLTEFVRALAPEDEVAIVFTGHSNLSQNFTRDRGVMLKTIEKVREALGFGLDALGRTNTSAAGSGVAGSGDPRIMMQYARSADYVLRNVAMSLAGSPHSRRAMVYVTGGSIVATSPTPARPNDFDYIQEAYEAARRADVPIYTIDPRGQVLPNDAVRGGIGVIGMTQQTEGGPPGTGNYTTIAANIRAQQSRLAEIAIATGGRHFIGQSDLTKATRAIVAENGSYYVLGYYPTPFDADGKFHTFDVRVKRPGVRVRARQGYVASAATAATFDTKPLLDGAMATGVNVSALPLRAFVAPLVPVENGVKTAVAVEVTYPVRPDARQIDDELRVSLLALDPDAKVKASAERTLRFQGTASEGAGTVTVLLDEAIDLPSQPLVLRIGVAARALGKAGTVQVSVDVPKPSDNRLQLGGVAIATEGAAPPALNASVLADLLPFQPLVSRTFATADTLRISGRAFWRDRDAPVITVGVKTRPTAALKASLDATTGANGARMGAFDARLPLASLPPGRYVLEVSARLRNGRPVTRDIPIELR